MLWIGMHATMANSAIFALFNLGGGEIILILALLLILLGAKRLPDLARRVGRGVQEGLDEQAADAGRSIGGIYGKPAAEALTPDNRTAELYDPYVFRKQELSRKPNILSRWYAIIRRLGKTAISSLIHRHARS
jgi:hypothetical protein